MKHFHSYLLGHQFTLQTDHEPLRTLFSSSKTVPPHASSQIQRWAWTLAAYEYGIVCRKTDQHANADAMSRLPLPYTPEETAVPAELVLMVEGLQDAPIKSHSGQDVIHRWPGLPDAYWRVGPTIVMRICDHTGQESSSCRLMMVVFCGEGGREHLLIELHGGHPG